MPREQINFPHEHPAIVTGISPADRWEPTTSDDVAPGRVTYDYVEPRLHVNWLKVDDFGAGHVQISIEVHPQDVISRADQASEILTRMSTTPEEGVVQTLSSDTSIFQYTPPLSRDEINKLIRVLRRARDAVFGGDE